MRKIITFSVLILLFSLFSGSVFAGDKSACAEFKKNKEFKGLYGLCVAYQNADEKGKINIFSNWEKKVGDDGEPQLPGHDYGDEVFVCPCWDFETIRQAIACDGFSDAWSGSDTSGDNSGEDFIILADPSFQTLIQMFAGNTAFTAPETPNECRINAPAEYVIEPIASVSGSVEDQCRLDVMDLIEESVTPGVCPPPQ